MSEEKDRIEEETIDQNTEQEVNDKAEESADETTAKKETGEVKEKEAEKNPLAELEEEKKELQDKYIRLYSEFENFRRRTAKEKQELRLVASQDLMVDLLPILDDFERGIEAMAKAADVKSASDGVELIYNKFKGILSKKGLKPIEAKEKEFDLDLHEALTKFPAPNPEMKGKVMDEIEKGYTLHDKVIRHAKVVVAE
ncbi:MAG: nucleotide exchange factor GrpE [Bacteroidia bacterium]